MVDYIEGMTYREYNLKEMPVIVPFCGHVLSLTSMDGTMGMQDHYDISDDGDILGIKAASQPFSAKALKSCPMCRFPLRNIHRYNRIVKRGLIDQATQRFIVWANAQFVPLERRLHEQEGRLRDADAKIGQGTNSRSEHNEPNEYTIKPLIGGTRDNQIRTIRGFSGLNVRYAPILNVRRDILVFLQKVSEEEQPFSRVHQMVKNIRRQTGVQPLFEFDGSILQVRNRLLTTVLALRCDLAILSDFLNVYQNQSVPRFSQHKWSRTELVFDLSQNRADCVQLMKDAAIQHQPMHEIEARVFFARFVALERSSPTSGLDRLEQLVIQAHEELALAKSICASAPSTANMLSEIEDAETLLRGSTFYTTFTNEEKRAVYAAMTQEFSGTGHWYYCQNGHPV